MSATALLVTRQYSLKASARFVNLMPAIAGAAVEKAVEKVVAELMSNRLSEELMVV